MSDQSTVLLHMKSVLRVAAVIRFMSGAGGCKRDDKRRT